MKRFIVAAMLLLSGAAFAAQAPDSLVVTGPNNAQVPANNLLVTPTGGSQTTLSNALANPNVTGGTIAGGTIAAMKCDGITPDNNAFAAAVATGSPTILIPVTAAGCVINSELVPQSNQTIAGIGGGAAKILVKSPAARAFNLTGLTNVNILGLTLDGTNAAAGADFVRFLNTTKSKFIGNTIIAPSTQSNACIIIAQTSQDNEIAENIITSCAGTAIYGNNTNVIRNKIHHNTISGGTNFGIRMAFGASHNEISFNKIPNSGIEPIAVSLGSGYNQIIGNDVGLSGDNCISIVGDHNVIQGNHGTSCAKGGIYVWGFANTVIGNSLLNNNTTATGWPCVGVSANYGAPGQSNVIKGNTCDDDQAVPTQNGIVINTGLPTLWSNGLSVTAGQFVYYGLNNYVAVGSGTTGAAPPTCTSGTCSDGTITWTYQSSFQTQAGVFFNQVWDNNVIRFAGTGAYTNVTPPSKALNRNPDFLLDQGRAGQASSTVVNSGGYVLDGWRANVSNGAQFVYQQLAGISIPGYYNALSATSNTAFSMPSNGFFQLMDRIEGATIAPLAWGSANALPLTLEACINTTGVTGLIPFTLDNGSTTVYVGAFNVTQAGAWQCFSQNIPGATTGAWPAQSGIIGMRFAFSLGAGSSQQAPTTGWSTGTLWQGLVGQAQPTASAGNVVRFAAVHLYQAGAQYVPRIYQEELEEAGRWYYSSFLAHGVPSQNTGIAGALCTVNPVANGQPSLYVRPPTQMYGVAANMVVTTYNPSAANANWRNVTAGTDVAVSVDPASSKGPNGVLLTTGATVANAGDVLCIQTTIDSGL